MLGNCISKTEQVDKDDSSLIGQSIVECKSNQAASKFPYGGWMRAFLTNQAHFHTNRNMEKNTKNHAPVATNPRYPTEKVVSSNKAKAPEPSQEHIVKSLIQKPILTTPGPTNTINKSVTPVHAIRAVLAEERSNTLKPTSVIKEAKLPPAKPMTIIDFSGLSPEAIRIKLCNISTTLVSMINFSATNEDPGRLTQKRQGWKKMAHAKGMGNRPKPIITLQQSKKRQSLDHVTVGNQNRGRYFLIFQILLNQQTLRLSVAKHYENLSMECPGTGEPGCIITTAKSYL
ncbi:hypothetical protein TorRG33x02_241230 [Trema orientale]|uniref:Uncharacterized protein n=1 Tax=Trema orientale TaxID=63057 RepID=A0A2P5DUG8_TREOI|nr:hypothetical protein TorRG33x02_241230 [Trema orientale]